MEIEATCVTVMKATKERCVQPRLIIVNRGHVNMAAVLVLKLVTLASVIDRGLGVSAIRKSTTVNQSRVLKEFVLVTQMDIDVTVNQITKGETVTYWSTHAKTSRVQMESAYHVVSSTPVSVYLVLLVLDAKTALITAVQVHALMEYAQILPRGSTVVVSQGMRVTGVNQSRRTVYQTPAEMGFAQARTILTNVIVIKVLLGKIATRNLIYAKLNPAFQENALALQITTLVLVIKDSWVVTVTSIISVTTDHVSMVHV